jgi:manganese/zinc/iron transport system substrate-binding protein
MRRVTIALIALMFLLISGCGEKSKDDTGQETASEEQTKKPQMNLKVVATTMMIGDAVDKVGGRLVELTTLMGPDDDPHLYKPTNDDIEVMRSADVVFYNGHGLEEGMMETLERLSGETEVVALAEMLDKNMLIESDESETGFDPHVWFDVRLWMFVVDEIRNTLTALDPNYQDIYFGDASVYQDELSELHNYAYTELQLIPANKRVLITAHDAFRYFGQAYNLEVYALQGMSTSSEPREGSIEELAKMAVNFGSISIFTESTVPIEGIEAIVAEASSRGFEISVGGELYSDALGEPGRPQGKYIGMMQHNVQTIVMALRSRREAVMP